MYSFPWHGKASIWVIMAGNKVVACRYWSMAGDSGRSGVMGTWHSTACLLASYLRAVDSPQREKYVILAANAMHCLILFRGESNDAWSSFRIWGTTQESHAEKLLTFSAILVCMLVWNTVKHIMPVKLKNFDQLNDHSIIFYQNSLEKGRFHFKSSLSPSFRKRE